MTTDAWGRAIFDPPRLALVGASGKAGKLGALFMRNLLDGYRGELIPINPSDETVFDRRAYPRVSAVPGHVDLAVVVAPETAVLSAIEDCVVAGVDAAVIVTGGFAETGPAGKARQDRIAAVARDGNVRLVGPNCFGVINVHARLNASLGLGLPEAGGVSLFTQSGAYGMAAFSRSREGGVGFAKVVAPGNKIDVGETEIVSYLGDDPETRVIALLLESIADGAAFVDAVARVTPHKPVVVLKTGRHDAAQRAAASHTDALAGDYRIAAAALRQAGARLVDDGLALLDVAAALDAQPPLRGRRVAIISNSGGTGVELADLLEDAALEVPRLSDDLQGRIRPLIPAYGSPANPVDVTTDWSRFPDMYGSALHVLLESGEVDAVVPVLLQRSALMPEVAERVVAETRVARTAGNPCAVHVCWVGPDGSEENRRRLLSAGIPCHPWAARTARTLAATLARDVWPRPVPETALPRPEGRDADGWLAPDAAFASVSAAGIPCAPWRLVAAPASVAAVVCAARELGFPVVLKAVRPALVHKSEAGAVRTGVSNDDDVRAVLLDFERRLGPGPTLVQKQIGRGLELVIGAKRDPQFGPIVLFGLGGVWVEALDDVALRLAPFGDEEANAAIGELRAAKLLDGARGHEPVDRGRLAAMLATASRWIARAPWLLELDVNPIVVRGTEFCAVDARVRVTPPAASYVSNGTR
ncbi:MAG: acetate--CoA ligase [Vulcanimicrobiaceae bacterium]